VSDDAKLQQEFTDWCVDSRKLLSNYRELNFYKYSFENEDVEPNLKIPDDRLQQRTGLFRMLTNKTDVLLRIQKDLRRKRI
jgi:hypothetical protein